MEKQVGRRKKLPYQLEACRVYEGILLQKQTAPEAENGRKEPVCCISQQTLSGLKMGEELSIALPDGELYLKLIPFDGEMQRLHKKKYTKWLNYDKIKNGLVIRTRAGGDYFALDELGHRKKLKDYFITEKIPSDERNQVLLVAEESHILWIIGGRISADVKIDQNTQRILEMRIVGGKYHED
jgi:tRNA(Ile)-lysidine synthase